VGHERVGVLPRTTQWRKIVAELAKLPTAEATVSQLASGTLECVRTRFREMHRDTGVQAAFEFLVGLAASGGADEKPRLGWANLPVDFTNNPSPLRIAQALRTWVSGREDSLEYRSIAERAATDAITNWHSHQNEQGYLFDPSDEAANVWKRASNGAGFCELSRLFFAKFMERYLNYFLEREASAALPNIAERERFREQLRQHVDQISQHAFETAKITQSFAAGWYNRHARRGRPSQREIERFLSIAFGKMREELLREGSRP
jgi:hypothetical protein